MSPTSTAKNSTNVRRTVALALTIWGLAVFEGWHDGVFARLGDGELAALALFAFAFAPASYFFDANLRDMQIAWPAMAAALATAALGLALSAWLARDVAWLFAGPVALAVCAAAIDRALRAPSTDRLARHLSRARP